MKNPFWLKPRSSFEDFEAHKKYAKSRRSDDLYWAYWTSIAGGVNGWMAMPEIVDPKEHVSSVPIIIFAGAAALGQFLYFRGLAAEDRMAESWDEFETARQKELEAQRSSAQPSAETSPEATVTEPQEALPSPNPGPEPDQQTPPDNPARPQGE